MILKQPAKKQNKKTLKQQFNQKCKRQKESSADKYKKTKKKTIVLCRLRHFYYNFLKEN